MEKAYKIQVDGGVLEVSEIPDRTGIDIRVNGQVLIGLSHAQWEQLCGLKYSLECNPEPPEEE